MVALTLGAGRHHTFHSSLQSNCEFLLTHSTVTQSSKAGALDHAASLSDQPPILLGEATGLMLKVQWSGSSLSPNQTRIVDHHNCTLGMWSLLHPDRRKHNYLLKSSTQNPSLQSSRLLLTDLQANFIC